ncbi:hypothetical protein [Phyllobacterium endophyticum]|uniref:hypothetical protein n=1 Tax=Phyllobacterium endophyticum TaxID=1149773 RepID=UPI0011B20737|nr:hypothetical protein [Phyllobacterium endophyticum]MBB3234744.1 hypothetical protein [Phyllobacterium endophyticum]TYR38873.1 hypothetical protein FY050_23130 [Phyllobacterium endophyticum]
MPPFNETNQALPPKLDKQITGSVEVTHVPKQLPVPSKPKTVGVYSLQYDSYKQVATRRNVAAGTPGSVTTMSPDPEDAGKFIFVTYEGIETYLKRALDNRFALLHRAMLAAFTKHSPKEFDVSFFTAPEFYWNVPFGDFLTEAELQLSTKLYLETVTRNARTLISKFPAKRYGHIVLLPGTIATLKRSYDATKPDGSAIAIYNAANHLTCTHNLPLDDKSFPRPAYMIWPKRVVSWIDYKDTEGCDDDLAILNKNPTNPDLNNTLKKCVLNSKNGLTVFIERVSSSVARSFDSMGNPLSTIFQNDIIEGLPFGIDICLDYSEASVQKDKYRIAQLDEREFKLDFLISAGMSLSTSNYADTPYIQYAMHTEGIGGWAEAWKLTYTKAQGNRPGTISGDNLAPLDADSAQDTKKGEIAIDQTDAFVTPEDADTTGIPNILDKMKPGTVLVWKLDVDQPADEVVANNPIPTKKVADKAIQFIE